MWPRSLGSHLTHSREGERKLITQQKFALRILDVMKITSAPFGIRHEEGKPGPAIWQRQRLSARMIEQERGVVSEEDGFKGRVRELVCLLLPILLVTKQSQDSTSEGDQ